MRPGMLERAIAAGKHVYCEKPTATDHAAAIRVAELAEAKGVKNGVVMDKLFLPGLMKLAMLRKAGFFGRMLAVRCEFGYWVFEGDLQPIQRPSWNYRAEDGGGIVLDMMCHWRYVLDHTFGAVKSVSCLSTTHIPERWDEAGKPYKATADDAAFATFELDGGVIATINSSWVTRVYRDDLVDLPGRRHPRLGGRRPAFLQGAAARRDAAAGVEPGREADPRFPRRLAGGAGDAALSERLPQPVGDVHPPRRRGCAVPLFAARGRQGPATGRGGADERARAALGRRAGARA